MIKFKTYFFPIICCCLIISFPSIAWINKRSANEIIANSFIKIRSNANDENVNDENVNIEKKALSLNLLQSTLSNRNIIWWGDSILHMANSYLQQSLFWCSKNETMNIKSGWYCPTYCYPYSENPTSIIMDDCHSKIYPFIYYMRGIIPNPMDTLKVHEWYYIHKYNICIFEHYSWTFDLIDGSKVNNFIMDVFNKKLNNSPAHDNILISNLFGSHINHIYPEQLFEFEYGWSNLEFLMENVLNNIPNIDDFKCVIFGLTNPFCLEGFYGTHLIAISKWMVIQCKVHLFEFYYNQLLNEPTNTLDDINMNISHWILNHNISKLHLSPNILNYIPKIKNQEWSQHLDYDYLQYIQNITNKRHLSMKIVHILKLSDEERLLIQNCVQNMKSRWNKPIEANSSIIFKTNLCILYARSPLYSNIIQQRIKNFVLNKKKKYKKLVHFNQYELYRNMDTVCNKTFIGDSVHYPRYHALQLKELLNTINNYCL